MSTALEHDLGHVVSAAERCGPLLSICAHPGCTILTMGGGKCLEHDEPVTIDFPRGRPYLAPRQADPRLAPVE